MSLPPILRLACFALGALSSPSFASAATLRVPADHPSIRLAVARAAPGDTIRISPGTYAEKVFVSLAKPGLRIEGIGRVILDPTGVGPGPALRIDASRVVVENLIIRGAYTGVAAGGAWAGIGVHVRVGARAVRLRDVTTVRCSFAGFVLDGDFTILERCAARGGRFGWIVAGDDGRVAQRASCSSPGRPVRPESGVGPSSSFT